VTCPVGTPVDPVPRVVADALAAASNAPGYPPPTGHPGCASRGRLAGRRHGVRVDPAAVLPVIGTKEFIAALPGLLGCGPGTASCTGTRVPDLRHRGPAGGRPGGGGRHGGRASPTPTVTTPGLGELAEQPNRPGPARGAAAGRPGRGAGRGSGPGLDECYLELGWSARPVSVMHPDVSGGSLRGLLAVHSLSKRSNMAGYGPAS